MLRNSKDEIGNMKTKIEGQKWNGSMKKKKKLIVLSITLLCACAGCGKQEEFTQEQVEIQDASEIGIRGEEDQESKTQINQKTEAELLQYFQEQNIVPIDLQKNTYDTLKVATYLTKIEDTYYLADCYHNQILFNDNLATAISEWKVLTNDVHYAHTIASDGRTIIIDDTENNRVVSFVKIGQGYYQSESLENTGMKPHFTYYDEKRDWFMVWSSITGEMYYLGYNAADTALEVKHVSKVDELFGVYVRSFSVIEDSIYFVSGHNNQKIIKVNADAFAKGSCEIEEVYPVTGEIAGMVQLVKIQGYYYISVSTDNQENQEYATWIRTKDLNTLANGEYEDVYDELGIAKGTPYNITELEGRYYMAHHGTQENIVAFDVIEDEICNVEILH